jgi:uncharacterized membrane protein
MESSTRSGIDLAAQRTYPGLALILAILSVPGSTVAWDLFDGAGFAIGMPLAIVAIVLGVRARRASQNGRRQATAAIVIAGAMVALTVVWTLASL